MLCSDCRCCSMFGRCGTGPDFCNEGCQSQCNGCADPGDGIASIHSSSIFNKMLKHRNDTVCPARDFYSYEAFVAAADNFGGGLGTTGDVDTRKREVAAFLAQTAYATKIGWPTPPDEPYARGYCIKEQVGGNKGPDYCDAEASSRWPCVAGKKYYGRGPFQLTWNYNYGPAGEALGVDLDLLRDPVVAAGDPVFSFEMAIWYWMTPRSPRPSCHDVITGQWKPSEADLIAGRVPGYGAVTNVVNGEVECGHGAGKFGVVDRIGFYTRFCDILGVSYGRNLDCYNQKPFGSAIVLAASNKTANISYHTNA